ncbi:F0F1 ATP synthase subunit epsilon [Collimonas pratensis]|jgi:F-type H+-transporting ATPase subunit epsilon|uniref:ATP synthase epsilon chain n=1 Tax=Collimonas pratensis TaxID=279113 RepID=A0A127R5B7_9BURK|nr:F0F1 ATP synthase subunit epsilon [Collimonas pratensis]AMP07488.1 ATP synthase F1, epsilon subunit [Collimonas pratensis]AMP17257.1 ATP synthase F1, epsilon subunit [Collimonas pratensis]NKI71376.1 F0F1 ATP synthase subunit epsilon [Collimonas pratensis]
MSETQVVVVSPEGELYAGSAGLVTLPGIEGSLGILPGHTPLLTRLKPGAVHIQRPSGEDDFIYVAGGYAEIQPHSVTILADTAIRGKDLDEAKATLARQQAEERLQNLHSDIDYALAQAELAQATAQLATLAQMRRGK